MDHTIIVTPSIIFSEPLRNILKLRDLNITKVKEGAIYTIPIQFFQFPCRYHKYSPFWICQLVQITEHVPKLSILQHLSNLKLYIKKRLNYFQDNTDHSGPFTRLTSFRPSTRRNTTATCNRSLSKRVVAENFISRCSEINIVVTDNL